jgi:hypothetical protein
MEEQIYDAIGSIGHYRPLRMGPRCPAMIASEEAPCPEAFVALPEALLLLV